MATPFLQRIEAGGTNLTFTTLARLCDGFGVDAPVLLKPSPAPERRPPGRPARRPRGAVS